MPFDAQLDALLRLVLAGVAAGLLGVERETQDKPAGTRTFAVVGIGACLFTVASERAFSGADAEVSRVVAQIVTGVGFLGAGTIIQVKDRVEGLTTAAGIWSAAAIGMTFGFGLYVLGIGSTIVLLVAIAVIGRLLPVGLGGVPDEPADDRDQGGAEDGGDASSHALADDVAIGGKPSSAKAKSTDTA
jgi:putative Mg2+ transporter-C (MgtC) family protein